MTISNYVSGPVNTVRLEGSINGVKKIIYLFMDFHADLHHQTECEDIRSLDIDKYLVQTFDKAYEKYPNKMFDLFVENNPMYTLRSGRIVMNKKGTYLFDQTRKLVKQGINMKEDKMYLSESIKNVRFHFADIREYTVRNDNIEMSIMRTCNVIKQSGYVLRSDIIGLSEMTKILTSYVGYIYTSIYDKDTNSSKSPVMFVDNEKKLMEYTNDDYKKISDKIVYKLKKKYTHDIVKSNINYIIGNEIHTDFKFFFDKTTSYNKFLNEYIKVFQDYNANNINNILVKNKSGYYYYGFGPDHNNIINQISSLYDIFFNYNVCGIGVNLMDAYVMRRVLDKDYVNNAIIYTGAAHSINYIRILIKYFDFKLTHYSYLKDNNINKVQDIVKKSKHVNELNEYFFPLVLLQCSNLESFPPLFS